MTSTPTAAESIDLNPECCKARHQPSPTAQGDA